MKTKLLLLTLILSLTLGGCASENKIENKPAEQSFNTMEGVGMATFAGGCFWCIEAALQETPGVIKAISGYAGGTEEEATYKKVYTGETGHKEAVQIQYDPSDVDYRTLVETFFQQIDPNDDGGQFSDRGNQYRTAIFYHDEEQKEIATELIQELEDSQKFDQPIVTEILPYTTFFPAEEYHQDFYKKSSDYYEEYKEGSGRAGFISENWAKELGLENSRENEVECESYKCFQKPSEEKLREKLTSLQYEVTQEDGTEAPYDNEYWENKEEGIYVDVVSGEPLFSSLDKYDSETGWPSFTKPIAEDLVTLHSDAELGYERIEARSKIADSHLGHVFDDGPVEKGGKRWCINSAALKFIPKEELTGEYEAFQELFI